MLYGVMQLTERDRRQTAVACPTCGAAHTVGVASDVDGDPVATTRRALFGEFTRETCSSDHSFFVYYC